MRTSRFLNLGCGSRYHPDWTNINNIKTGPGIIVSDLSNGIPFPDRSFDLVYSSHLLEHFSRSSATGFLKECYRVLSSKGVLRIVAPDLEDIVREYIKALDQARKGSDNAEHNYEWIMLEMYDQAVREEPGGDMGIYLERNELPNKEFVTGRCGAVATKSEEPAQQTDSLVKNKSSGSRSGSWVFKMLRFLRDSNIRRESLLKYILKEEYSTLQMGRFRMSGEIHQWMYDSYSLEKIIEENGFVNSIKRSATESYIVDWPNFKLDTESDGSIYKPDSLYMEATKP